MADKREATAQLLEKLAEYVELQAKEISRLESITASHAAKTAAERVEAFKASLPEEYASADAAVLEKIANDPALEEMFRRLSTSSAPSQMGRSVARPKTAGARRPNEDDADRAFFDAIMRP